MAERRMFAKTIINSDAFLDMPEKAQLLYFHLGMNADDDGFVNKTRWIMRLCNCTDEELDALVKNRMLIVFENGITVIRHWKAHNSIRKDRHTGTVFAEELALLEESPNGIYMLKGKTSTKR